jgi:hypothetical protein
MGENIWSDITLEKLVAAITSVISHENQLKGKTWRLNDKSKLSPDLWTQIIEKLNLEPNERIRQSLYSIWHKKRHDIDKIVEEKLKLKAESESDGTDGGTVKTEKLAIAEKNIPNLSSKISLPLPMRPNTRANQAKNLDDASMQNSPVTETSFTLTAAEWKAAFSRTRQEMNEGWTTILYEKLKSCGIVCAVKFKKSHTKQGERKQVCGYFWCRAVCTNSSCTRSYYIILKDEADFNTSVLFLLRISGKENHDPKKETMTRHLTGKQRYLVGMYM